MLKPSKLECPSSSCKPEKRVVAPPGLEKLLLQCQALYPDQANPLQVTTVLKYWLGGHDPLDYISMYYNPGDPSKSIPPHWHYISFGLSDLHGDGRVHIPDMDNNLQEARSGMGFELTFRLYQGAEINKRTDRAPLWPAGLLQALARYVFQTGNRLCVGDNVPWRRPLDSTESKIQHMLIGEDSQLKRMQTPFGWVDFCQVVGVTDEELEHASRWNGVGVLNLLKQDPSTGGERLITDMARSRCVFEMFPDTLQKLEVDLEKEGSDLAGVNALFSYKELTKSKIKTEIDDNELDANAIEVFNKFAFMSSAESDQSFALPQQMLHQVKTEKFVAMEGVELTIAPHAAKFLMLAIKDRIRHGRHFTFKSKSLAITFVADSVTGSVVNAKTPYGLLGYWMQILIPNDLVPQMIEEFKNSTLMENKIEVPLVFDWPEKNLKIIIDTPQDG